MSLTCFSESSPSQSGVVISEEFQLLASHRKHPNWHYSEEEPSEFRPYVKEEDKLKEQTRFLTSLSLRKREDLSRILEACENWILYYQALNEKEKYFEEKQTVFSIQARAWISKEPCLSMLAILQSFPGTICKDKRSVLFREFCSVFSDENYLTLYTNLSDKGIGYFKAQIHQFLMAKKNSPTRKKMWCWLREAGNKGTLKDIALRLYSVHGKLFPV